jgi:hypothetical protein
MVKHNMLTSFINRTYKNISIEDLNNRKYHEDMDLLDIK